MQIRVNARKLNGRFSSDQISLAIYLIKHRRIPKTAC